MQVPAMKAASSLTASVFLWIMLDTHDIDRLGTPVSKQNTCGHRLQNQVDEGQASRGKLLKMLHQRCTELKQELRETLSKHCTEMTFKPVQRKYAFEDGRVPQGLQWVLKVSCDAAPGAVASSLSGRNFTAILGTAQTPLELLQLKRKIMGPSWLRLNAPAQVEVQAQLSWCKVRPPTACGMVISSFCWGPVYHVD